MNKIKKYLKPLITGVIILAIYLFLLSILHFTGLITLSSVVNVNFVLVAIISLIFGISRGKKASKRGYLEGLKFGAIIVGIMFILNLIFYRSFSLYIFLYYLMILVSMIIGSMIGINLKR